MLSIVLCGVDAKARLGCDSVSADRAAPALTSPYANQLVSAFAAVQHFLAVAFLVVSRPPFVERVGFCHNLLKSRNLGVCSIFQG